MMKIRKIYGVLMLLLTISFGCTEFEGIDLDTSFVDSATTANLSKVFQISDDNSGNVKITPIGEGFSSAIVYFGHGTGAAASATVSSCCWARHRWI